MTSKTKAASKKEEGNPALMPKRRFPEFRDAEEWESKSMGEVYSFKGHNSLSRDKLNYESGSVKNIHYGDIHTKFSTHFDITKEIVPYVNQSVPLDAFKAENFCVEGDMIFADASEDLEDIGKAIEIVRLNGERVLSGLHTILARQTEADLVRGFGGHLFKSKRVRTLIQKESQGSKVLGLSGGRLEKIEIPFPSSPREQQKITDCLSSLDEVIAAQARKLDALKTHKKGLMQELFPREGETQPHRRFPEFEDAGEWETVILGSIAKFTSGGTPAKNEASYWNGSIPWISASSMHSHLVEDSKLRVKASAIGNGTRIAKKGSILILVRGSMLFKRVPICLVLKDVAFNQDVKSISLKDDIDTVFLLYQLIAFESRFSISRTGIGAGKIDTEDLKSLDLFVPSPAEQQRIASCLTSLNDLIVALTQKLESLRTHKRGLMQQLFPSPESNL